MTWTNPNNTQVTSLAVLGTPSGSPNAGTIPSAGGAFNVTQNAPGAIQIGATGIYVVNVAQFSSYDLNMYAYTASAGSLNSNIVVQITLQWFDDLQSGIPIFEEDWWVWCARQPVPYNGGGTNLTNTLAGSGPMHGVYMAIYVSTAGSSVFNATLKYFYLFGSVRTVPYSDWRQNGEACFPNENGAVLLQGGGLSFENILASTAGTVLGNNFYFMPLGLYSGPVFYFYQANPAANVSPVIISCAALVSGQMMDSGVNGPGVLANINNGVGVIDTGTIFAPRAPLALLITGVAAGTTTFGFQAVAQQAA